ncbi:hypothetical protein RB623_25100 [Mesorhizobium sp. LHD-90]|uniref:hypothetical protein n=1 Tax=Mesorhizobium sp. LHD-90 TaxID=3071414 RepID=UPI0027DFEAF7|nr:hypothetical protein [Mesorhizobium sp. LHD-90]MDQ6437344.1 hypothetical protein [Mesorhizobium sp. LHD-90]
METNRTDHALPGRLVAEIFEGFGEEDSIVDRLLALPVAVRAEDGRTNAWEAGVAKRLEKVLADRMRERIEGGFDRPSDKAA